mgnify:CR=1 FL=1
MFIINYVDMTRTAFIHLYLDKNFDEEEVWQLLNRAYGKLRRDRKSTYLMMIELHQI